MDQIKCYHKTCAECVKHGVMCTLCPLSFSQYLY